MTLPRWTRHCRNTACSFFARLRRRSRSVSGLDKRRFETLPARAGDGGLDAMLLADGVCALSAPRRPVGAERSQARIGRLTDSEDEAPAIAAPRFALRRPDCSQRVDDGAHTPRTRDSVGFPPLGEGRESAIAATLR